MYLGFIDGVNLAFLESGGIVLARGIYPNIVYNFLAIYVEWNRRRMTLHGYSW